MKSAPLLLLAAAAAAAFAPPSGCTAQSPRAQTSALSFFFGGAGAKASPKSSPLADEAVAIYDSKYAGGTPRKFFFDSWGMPERARRTNDEKTSLLFERDDRDLVATFNEIASLYGEDNALDMVKIQPNVLAFNKDLMRPSLEAFGENFGMDQSKAMIIRNPGLLGVKPQNAAAADDLTMKMSYVVYYTRPIGALGPVVIVSLLTVPAIESAMGVGRGELLSGLLSGF